MKLSDSISDIALVWIPLAQANDADAPCAWDRDPYVKGS